MRVGIILPGLLLVATLASAISGSPADRAAGSDLSTRASPDGSMLVALSSTTTPSVGIPHEVIVHVTALVPLEPGAWASAESLSGLRLLSAGRVPLAFTAGQAVASFIVVADEVALADIVIITEAERGDGYTGHGAAVGHYRFDTDGVGVFGEQLPPADPALTISLPLPPGYDPHANIHPDGVNTPTVNAGPTPLPDDPPPSTGVGGLASSYFQVTACWYFEKQYDPNWNLPGRWVTVRVMDDEVEANNAHDLLWQGLTNSNGCFTTPLILRNGDGDGTAEDPYVVFQLTNSHTDVTYGGTLYQWRTQPTTWNYQGDVLNLQGHKAGDSPWAPRAFQWLSNAWDFADNQNYGNLAVNWKVVAWMSGACSGGAPACYTPGNDRITMASASDLWPDIAPHEYAHFLMDKIYGPGDGSNHGGAHTFCGANQGTGLAFEEGYANWFGAATELQMSWSGIPHGETNTGYAGNDLETIACTPRPSGDQSEANVAATFWDLWDVNQDTGTYAGNLYTDIHGFATASIMDVFDDCNNLQMRPYYDGSCSWAQHYPSSASAFRRVARINTIDYGAP